MFIAVLPPSLSSFGGRREKTLLPPVCCSGLSAAVMFGVQAFLVVPGSGDSSQENTSDHLGISTRRCCFLEGGGVGQRVEGRRSGSECRV